VPAAEVCAPDGQIWPLERFKPAYVCLTINDKRAVFDTLTDSFRSVELTGSFNNWVKGQSGDVLLSVASMGGSSTDTTFSLSANKLYALTPPPNLAVGSANPERLVISVYTVVIAVEEGIVQSITFDDGCFLCGGNDSPTCVVNARQITPGGAAVDEAVQRGCATPISQCRDLPPAPGGNSTASVSNTCDLRLWITWAGTDVKNRYFTSFNKRFSRYRGWGMVSHAAAPVPNLLRAGRHNFASLFPSSSHPFSSLYRICLAWPTS
jgi:hypothetical protein